MVSVVLSLYLLFKCIVVSVYTGLVAYSPLFPFFSCQCLGFSSGRESLSEPEVATRRVALKSLSRLGVSIVVATCGFYVRY